MPALLLLIVLKSCSVHQEAAQQITSHRCSRTIVRIMFILLTAVCICNTFSCVTFGPVLSLEASFYS